MIIQIYDVEAGTVKTVIVPEVASDDVLEYWLCWYCGEKMVQMPDKFCCSNHRVYYYRKRIGEALS